MSVTDGKIADLVKKVEAQSKKEKKASKSKKSTKKGKKSGRILGGELYNIRQKYDPAEANRILKKYCKNRK